ncbi:MULTISPECIES: DUF3042 family protein [Liquorilactobacillus]|uniref:DUF3042 domain-containing protein n=1 Tax=Liquorilactobacillus aquaticus DSM 21051 TaxID=1423725 RepID=A0A0R2CXL4_9LACO|nr:MULTISPECIES: DUF3042 family protein [Liquorilactobacillus]KRM96584.1 hypothetical protein FC19_GL000881 [Liquorilactobacillus aquaticus DSM 21051]
MKNFAKGIFVGVAATVGVTAGCFYAFKKTVVDPVEEKEAMIDEHRRRAIRKRHSAHQY